MSDQAVEFKAGDRVIYIPGHAAGNRHHKDCDHGTVSSISPGGSVFVRFDMYVKRFGWDGATSQSCNARDLVLE